MFTIKFVAKIWRNYAEMHSGRESQQPQKSHFVLVLNNNPEQPDPTTLSVVSVLFHRQVVSKHDKGEQGVCLSHIQSGKEHWQRSRIVSPG